MKIISALSGGKRCWTDFEGEHTKRAGRKLLSLRPARIAETGDQLPHLLFGSDVVRLFDKCLLISLRQGFKPFHGSLVLCQRHTKTHRKFHKYHRG